MDKMTVAHTRLHLANERTLLAWTKLASIIAAGGFLTRLLVPSQRALTLDEGPPKSATVLQVAQMMLAVVVLGLGLNLFRRRRVLLASKWLGSYSAPISPWAAIVGVLATLLLTLFQALAHEVEYNSPGCLRLKRPLVDAPPPYLYVSFHGSADPLGGLCSGVGAVQRFSLAGEYVGPATDQRAALVHSPRMMTMHNELLVLADAGEGARLHRPALAVFGDCAGKGVRPFLGRIRATDAAVEQSFLHPYGLASSRSGMLRASSQNGGALLEVDLNNASHPLNVLLQLESAGRGAPVEGDASPRSPAGLPWSEHGVNAVSGPLRGIDIDDDDCTHVADKRADKIWHVCHDQPLRSTKVLKPIGVHAHGTKLYVGSFTPPHGAVHMLERRTDTTPGTGEGEGDAYHITRSFTHKRLVHPAGLLVTHTAVQSGVLYVLEQSKRALLAFDLATGNLTGTVLHDLPDVPEGLMLSLGC